MQCPLHNQKLNKPSFYGASCQLAPFNSLNTQSTVPTNSSVMVASVIDGEWRWRPYQNLLNSVFIPYNMSASVIECRSIGSCSSSGLCAGLMITGLQFQLLFTLPPLWHRMPVRVWKQFSRTCAIIQIKYVLPKLCHLPQYSYGSRDPTTRVLCYASHPGLGTRDAYSYWGRWHSMAAHT